MEEGREMKKYRIKTIENMEYIVDRNTFELFKEYVAFVWEDAGDSFRMMIPWTQIKFIQEVLA